MTKLSELRYRELCCLIWLISDMVRCEVMA